jgi:hypothetical protein
MCEPRRLTTLWASTALALYIFLAIFGFVKINKDRFHLIISIHQDRMWESVKIEKQIHAIMYT